MKRFKNSNNPEPKQSRYLVDDVLADFDNRNGIGSAGYEEASNYIPDFFEYYRSIGKENTGILELYMLAYKLAQKQLKESVKE